MKTKLLTTLLVLLVSVQLSNAQSKSDKKRLKAIEKSFGEIKNYEDTLYYKGKAIGILKTVTKATNEQLWSLSGELLVDFKLAQPVMAGYFKVASGYFWTTFKGHTEVTRVFSTNWNLGFIQQMIDDGMLKNGQFDQFELNSFILKKKRIPIEFKMYSDCPLNVTYILEDPTTEEKIEQGGISKTSDNKTQAAVGDKIWFYSPTGSIGKVELTSKLKYIQVNGSCAGLIVD